MPALEKWRAVEAEMGMTFHAVAVTAARLAELRRNPAGVINEFFPEDGSEPPADESVDLDKAWHGLHYLLTGDPWQGEPPLCWAILGGEPIGDDTGYGPPRFLTPDQVVKVMDALDGVTHADLEARFDPAAMSRAEIYPGVWDRLEWDGAEWLTVAFDQLVTFYRRAATNGRAVLLILT